MELFIGFILGLLFAYIARRVYLHQPISLYAIHVPGIPIDIPILFNWKKHHSGPAFSDLPKWIQIRIIKNGGRDRVSIRWI